MSTCRFCDRTIFWETDEADKFRCYEDEDCLIPHRCEHYKKDSEGLRLIKERAAKEREAIWGTSKRAIK